MQKIIRIVGSVIIMLASIMVHAQGKFTIKGHIKNMKDGTLIFLGYLEGINFIQDSAIVSNGSFTFSGTVREPVKARINVKQDIVHAGSSFGNLIPMEKGEPVKKKAIKAESAKNDEAMATISNAVPTPGTTVVSVGENVSFSPGHSTADTVTKPTITMHGSSLQMPDNAEFYLEKGTITITGTDSLSTAVIRGGKTQKDFAALNKWLLPLYEKMDPLYAGIQKAESEGREEEVDKIKTQLSKLQKEEYEKSKEFVQSHPDSYVSLNIIQSNAYVIDVNTFEPLYNLLGEKLKETEKGKAFAKKLLLAKKLAVGQPAINFVQNNTEGVPVSLASFKGKYVLVDFWASWCMPCRAENPNVLKAYNQFKDKGLEIISVSLDTKKELWIAAIKKDGMPWIHVSDLKGWDNQVAQDYDIKAVPQNVLINPKGVIIAKNLHGEDLEKKLGEVLK